MGNLLSSTAAAVRRSNTEDSDAYRGGSSGGGGAYRSVEQCLYLAFTNFYFLEESKIFWESLKLEQGNAIQLFEVGKVTF